ncbi:ArsR/SmtB family transcription factor [Halorarius halobius]|uniref:ArsR/SmtB family transcription factor n=1 Tax=Halorarius halobius TaxID=2962671 RepID=UPI0020CEC61A|nr:helix-turn-helix domain-containing protein [Halorarius halobius]
MASPIERLQNRTATPDERARVLEMADDDTDEVLDALSSDTRRHVVRALFEEPATASELADSLDTSVQNLHYHLTELEEVGLVEPIDTAYSEKGNEMTVYGPASDPLVFVGDDDRFPLVERSLGNVVGGLALLAGASLLVQWGAERLLRPAIAGGSAGPSSYGPLDPSTTGTPAWLVFEVLEPGVVFFAGCLCIAAVVALTLSD